jgi:hypothetical protein
MLQMGINNDVDNATYHGDKRYYSSSSLKLLLQNPHDFYKKHIAPQDGFKSAGSANMDLGSYVHSCILEPHKTDEEFAIWDGGIKRGDAWTRFQAENKNKIIITPAMQELGQELYRKSLAHKAVKSLLKDGTPEFTYCCQLMEENIKVRADYINLKENYILDVKTTSKPLTKDSLMGAIASLHYDLSAALYIDCFRQINNVEKMDFYFIFVNTKDSKEVEVFKASDVLINNGRRKYRKAIKVLKECLKSGIWRSEEIEEIDVPFWSLLPEESNE